MNRPLRTGITILLTAVAFLTSPSTYSQARLQFDVSHPYGQISSDLFGIFFEEINHGGEGGLYGEAIVNRSFDDDYGSFYGWSWQNADCSLIKTNLLNTAQRNACKVTFTSAAGWLRNSGFGGINIVRGEQYRVSLWVRADAYDFNGTISVRLVDPASGASYGTLRIEGPFTTQWRKCEGVIRPTTNITGGALQIQASAPTTLVFDMVSLFPPTFKDRDNGMRRDLAQMLADLHPRFMRFPGGCYIEGLTGWAVDPGLTSRWEWKKTIGPIEERPGHRNQNWGYWVSDGLGYHEFLQFCEDIGAAPMYVCNIGLGHGWVRDYRDIGEFVQETLDAIEYANGDSTTTWGRRRAQNGHPEPFGLKYVEIGNENCNYSFGNNSDQSDHYFERYIQFYNAIKAHWPDVTTIANVEAWGTDNPSWRSNYPVEIVDEHYYRDNNFYISNYNKYDGYSRAGAQIYIGEYAANVGSGNGNLGNALAEAIFLQGLENNADIVSMASFAPIFMNETYGGWNYDIIRFNHSKAYGIPSYYVQKMFGQDQGHYILHWQEEDNLPLLSAGERHIGVGTWLTTATFTDVLMTDTLGTTLFSQKENNSSVWTRGGGTWAYVGGTIRQTNLSYEGATYLCNLDLPNEDFNYSLRATKTAGSEGFLVIFNYKDGQNYTWWNIGGWGNTACGIENCLAGRRTTVARADLELETGRTYDIRIEKRGPHIRCYLDGTLMHDTDIPAGYAKGVYVSASLTDDCNQAIVKLTNPNPTELPLTLSFTGASAAGVSAEMLTSESVYDENTMGTPTRVVPKATTEAQITADGDITYIVPAYSFTSMRVDLADVTMAHNEASLPTPVCSYSFENIKPESDDGLYGGGLHGKASIVEMTDGNHVLYTGAIGGRGYMNIDAKMPARVFKQGGDYTISMDVLNRTDNNLGSYSWALALSNTTSEYLGFINMGGGRNWYAELKNAGSTARLESRSALRSGAWHNLTYVQHQGMGRFYIDGRLYAERTVDVKPSEFASNITGCYIARSPFNADAYMENAYFDNLRIYDMALTAEQIALINDCTASMENDEIANLNLPNSLADLICDVRGVEQSADDAALTQALQYAEAHATGMASDVKHNIDILQAALDDYSHRQASLMEDGHECNLTYMLRNSTFSRGNDFGWSGTDMTAVAHETGEQFSRTFDNHQTLSLPAGRYCIMADAFYRYGDIAHATAHIDGDDATDANSHPAQMYASYIEADGALVEQVLSIHSIYDASQYTLSPYTYPDNLHEASVALNSGDGRYLNTLYFTLHTPSTVKVGIRKTLPVDRDWTAFDNFRLLFLGIDDTQITDVVTPAGTAATSVYDLTGRSLGTQVKAKGLYIINGNKVLIK